MAPHLSWWSMLLCVGCLQRVELRPSLSQLDLITDISLVHTSSSSRRDDQAFAITTAPYTHLHAVDPTTHSLSDRHVPSVHFNSVCTINLLSNRTTCCIVYTNIQPVVKPVVQSAVQLYSRLDLDKRLHRVNKHPTGCTTGLTTGCIV